MGVGYQAILWNRQKRLYDLALWGLMLFYLLVYVLLSFRFDAGITPETLIIRSTGTLALLMLHVVLSIGPLSRIDKRFLILLYNRRHLGVSLFLIALIHGTFNIIQFHSLGNVPALVSLFSSNTHYTSFINFPFQVLGFFALMILLLMAATSHDFWLHHLSPRIWKSLHMLVYVAYALLILHVSLGVLQLEKAPILFYTLFAGLLWLCSLHLYAGRLETKKDRIPAADDAGWLRVGPPHEIPEKKARIIFSGKERIAVFKYDGKISAVSNVCKHQMGPLGEGRIIDGCITCPWHGYQYLPHNGCSPPPFLEKIATYELKFSKGEVYVNPAAREEGSEVAPLLVPETPPEMNP